MTISTDWDVLRKLRASHLLEPYIQYIRFPYFKNLDPGLKVEFDYPLTALVGQNGTNKSSVLRAIYGCPEDSSVGNFWFSTDVDQITEDGGRPRFIYSYFQAEAKRDVEVIKTRIFKSKDPDYWEPSRPIIGDGMKAMPKDGSMAGRSKTRWKLMRKEVLFMDFRSEISAYDKYFYHGDLKQTLRHSSKKDFIRSKSTHIKEAVDSDLKTKKMYKGQKEHILSNFLLPDDQLMSVSQILGRSYKNIRILKHRFFKLIGESVIMESQGLNYSEAFAGSGEFAVVMLVNRVAGAPGNSLIILDEPEVSLHPGAQERLIQFLLKQIIENKHQIIIGTHSPHILKGLPPAAIKTLYLDPATSKIKATDETVAEEAFFHLGMTDRERKTIFVEDRLAAEVVRKALRKKGEGVYNAFSIMHMPGGASVLLTNYLPAYALTNRGDSLFLLDEDQMPHPVPEIVDDLELMSDDDLTNALKVILNGKPTIHVDGGKGGARDDQYRAAMIKVLSYTRKHLRYLPGTNPEQFVWENMQVDIDQYGHDFTKMSTFKEKFELLTKLESGREAYEIVNSDEIFYQQIRCLATVDDNKLDSVVHDIEQFLAEVA